MPTLEIERHAAAKLAKRDAFNLSFDNRCCAFDVGAANDAGADLVLAAFSTVAGRIDAIPGKIHEPRRLLTKIQSLNQRPTPVSNIDLYV